MVCIQGFSLLFLADSGLEQVAAGTVEAVEERHCIRSNTATIGTSSTRMGSSDSYCVFRDIYWSFDRRSCFYSFLSN